LQENKLCRIEEIFESIALSFALIAEYGGFFMFYYATNKYFNHCKLSNDKTGVSYLLMVFATIKSKSDFFKNIAQQKEETYKIQRGSSIIDVHDSCSVNDIKN
jgi:hypothetical protein